MFETIIIVLVIMWLLGFFVVHVGTVIHALLVVALVMLIIRLTSRKPVL